MKYDDASWHFEGDFPEDLPEDNAYTHIAMYLAWAISNDLAGELHLEDSMDDIKALKNNEITGIDFLKRNCDGMFTDEDLNDIGNKFTSSFYEDEYFSEYIEASDPEEIYETVYHIPYTQEIYTNVAKMLSKHFNEWKQSNS